MLMQVLGHFKKVDPLLAKVALKIGKVELRWRPGHDFFMTLCNTIISQQLSDKVATVITNRFENLFAGYVSAEEVIKIDPESLRQAGMSGSKVKFIKSLAQAVVEKQIDLPGLVNLTNEEVMQELIKLPGIGPWTAEMFLMFSLGRKDVFSVGDLGLKRAIQKLYRLEAEPSKQELLDISQKWSPYRSYACLVLWKMMDLPAATAATAESPAGRAAGKTGATGAG